MINWYEALPGFWLPKGWDYDPSIWPDYTKDEFVAGLSAAPDELTDIFRIRNLGRPSKQAWGAWMNAYNNDKPLKRGWPELEKVADAKYETARYIYLVPAWRRAITQALTALDDIEDQLSTILWVLEIISKRFIPLPPKLLSGAERVRRTLDCSEKVLSGITPFRGHKSEYEQCLKEINKAKQQQRERVAGLLDWFKQNWGRLLEAAQATNTWFGVGIVLGPIFAWIEEGLWGLAKKTVDNYLIAADAILPGYREDFWRNASELVRRVDEVWDQTWEGIKSWDSKEIEDSIGFFAP